MLQSWRRSLGSEDAGQGLRNHSVVAVERLREHVVHAGRGHPGLGTSHHLHLVLLDAARRGALKTGGPGVVAGSDVVWVGKVEPLDGGQVACGVLLLLELHQAGSLAAAESPVLVEGAVALGVGHVPGGVAVRTRVAPQHWTRDQTCSVLHHVTPVLILTLSVGETEAADVHPPHCLGSTS